MAVNNRYFKRCRVNAALMPICIFLAVFAMVTVFDAVGNTAISGTKESVSGKKAGIIVIDPGHGGNDHGVTGPDEIVEKQVMLALARRISDQLEPAFIVHLTRTGDYDVTAKDRSSIANFRKADIFISLHAGGSFRKNVNGWAVYHDQAKPPLDNLSGRRQAPLPWNRLQQRHIPQSRVLAGDIKNRLEAGSAKQGVDITGAPLVVLSGADMPAVMIEAGYLTHPLTARQYMQKSYIEELAEDIAMGIRDFLENNDPGP